MDDDPPGHDRDVLDIHPRWSLLRRTTQHEPGSAHAQPQRPGQREHVTAERHHPHPAHDRPCAQGPPFQIRRNLRGFQADVAKIRGRREPGGHLAESSTTDPERPPRGPASYGESHYTPGSNPEYR